MTANVYAENGQIICVLDDVSISHIESNAYRIIGLCKLPIISTTQIENVTVELVENEKTKQRLTRGYATAIQSYHISIDALLEE